MRKLPFTLTLPLISAHRGPGSAVATKNNSHSIVQNHVAELASFSKLAGFYVTIYPSFFYVSFFSQMKYLASTFETQSTIE